MGCLLLLILHAGHLFIKLNWHLHMGLPFWIFKHALSILILSIPKDTKNPPEIWLKCPVGMGQVPHVLHMGNIAHIQQDVDPPVVVLCCLQCPKAWFARDENYMWTFPYLRVRECIVKGVSGQYLRVAVYYIQGHLHASNGSWAHKTSTKGMKQRECERRTRVCLVIGRVDLQIAVRLGAVA